MACIEGDIPNFFNDVVSMDIPEVKGWSINVFMLESIYTGLFVDRGFCVNLGINLLI